jgi:hypothetical protein
MATAKKTVKAPDTTAEQAMLDKLSTVGGSHVQWDAAWQAYKNAAGIK